MEIKDKVIIVTGASQGIGLVLAARTAQILTGLEIELPGSLAIITDMRKSEAMMA